MNATFLRWLSVAKSRLLAMLRRSGLEHDLDEELAFHVAMREAEHRRKGLMLVDAAATARREFGNVTILKEQARDAWVLPFVESWCQDVRCAVRALLRNPAFSVAAMVTLTLGIGATTAIYSVVDTILIQPLPFVDADRLVRVVENFTTILPGRPPIQRGMTYSEFIEWRKETRTLSDPMWSTQAARLVRTSEGAVQLYGALVSADAFSGLGTRAFLGRTLLPSDMSNPDVVMLSFDTWQRIFHGDAGIVGGTVGLQASGRDDRILTIVGVLPRGVEFPGARADFFAPFVLNDAVSRSRGIMIARLRSGVTLRGALDEANLIGSAIVRLQPATAPRVSMLRFEVQVLKDQMVKDLRPALRVLLASVVALLMIVCANVANLLLARGTARQREMAVRVALGASRGRIVRQIMTECLVLGVIGGTLGALCGAAGVGLVKNVASIEAPGIFRFAFDASVLPRFNEVGINIRVFGVAFTLAVVASMLFGVLPALHLSQWTPLTRMGSRGGAGRRESTIRGALVVAQLVIATVLLVGAGLLARSFISLLNVEKGYDPENVLALQVVFPPDYALARKMDTIGVLLARLRAVPSVKAAGFTRAGILIPETIVIGGFAPLGRSAEEVRADPFRPLLRPVSDGFLTAMGFRQLDGRDLNPRDATSSPPAIVISRTVAQHYFRDGRAVGQFVDWQIDTGVAPLVQIVGVVEDVHNESPDRDANPEVFVDYRRVLPLLAQTGESVARQTETALGRLSFAVRTVSDPTAAVPVISRIVRDVDPNVGIDALVSMDQLVTSSVARPRFYVVMLGAFAGVAGMLAAIGIYGLLAYAVIQRTQEIGVRMALGAQPRQVLTLVLRQGLLLATVGIGAGLAGAVAAVRMLQGMLFGIMPLDPQTFIVVPIAFGLVATIACYLPARRATKVDPLVALRCE